MPPRINLSINKYKIKNEIQRVRGILLRETNLV